MTATPCCEDEQRRASCTSSPAVEGWLIPGRNPFGLYLYTERVDELAARFQGEILGQSRASQKHKPWGMYEFALVRSRTKLWSA